MVHLATKILLDDKLRFLTTVSGVAFAVMLVIVQVGIFLGMLESASITIERLEADLWVTAKNTPNIDFANTFPELYVHRVRSVPGVLRADNLIVWFVPVALPSGAKEATIIYALEDFRRWSFPGMWSRGIRSICGGGDMSSSTTRRRGGLARSRWETIANSWACA